MADDFLVFDEADAAVEGLHDQKAATAELRAALQKMSQELEVESAAARTLRAESDRFQSAETLECDRAKRSGAEVARLEKVNRELENRLAKSELSSASAPTAGAQGKREMLLASEIYAAEKKLLLKLATTQFGLGFLRVLAHDQLAPSQVRLSARWCGVSAARNVEVCDAGFGARRMITGKPWDGVVMSEHPIRVFPQGHYFAVQITEVDPRFQGGLGLGVTAENFAQLHRKCPAAAGEIESFTGVCSYYNGQLRKRGRFFPGAGIFGLPEASRLKEPHECDWKASQDLAVGDEVGLLVRPDGALSLFVNGERRLHVADAGAPSCAGPLFAVVDILGHCVAVQAKSSSPPISCARAMEEISFIDSPAPVPMRKIMNLAQQTGDKTPLPPISSPRYHHGNGRISSQTGNYSARGAVWSPRSPAFSTPGKMRLVPKNTGDLW